MFQSIKYLNYTYDNKTDSYHFNYEITDSDFISTSSPAVWAATVVEVDGESATDAAAVSVIKEYESRNYTHKEIISNLFLLNMFLLKEWGYEDLKQILKLQYKYLTKQYYPESNFREKYYNDLIQYTNKMITLI